MIIIHVMGGLGNQLYQYAMYEKLKSIGKEVKLDFYAYTDEAGEEKEWRNLELTRFVNLAYEECTVEERTALLDNSMAIADRIRRKLCGRTNKTLKDEGKYMPELYEMDQVYLYGYWDCEKYYEDRIKYLQSKIIFPYSDNSKNYICMEQMEKEQSVSMHIRRTDYLKVADGKRYMGICTDAYYKSAMQYIRERIKNPVFYVFSDDVEYVREHYQDTDIHIVDWNTDENSLFDMQLMSKCKHNICANSTFSFWGARLNQNIEKIMIRPLKHDNYETVTAEQVHEEWPGWILIDAEGNVCS